MYVMGHLMIVALLWAARKEKKAQRQEVRRQTVAEAEEELRERGKTGGDMGAHVLWNGSHLSDGGGMNVELWRTWSEKFKSNIEHPADDCEVGRDHAPPGLRWRRRR